MDAFSGDYFQINVKDTAAGIPGKRLTCLNYKQERTHMHTPRVTCLSNKHERTHMHTPICKHIHSCLQIPTKNITCDEPGLLTGRYLRDTYNGGNSSQPGSPVARDVECYDGREHKVIRLMTCC